MKPKSAAPIPLTELSTKALHEELWRRKATELEGKTILQVEDALVEAMARENGIRFGILAPRLAASVLSESSSMTTLGVLPFSCQTT